MKNNETIKTTTEELLSQLTIEASVEVVEREDTYQVKIETEDAGVLIGYHGRTLNSFQTILSQILFKKTGEWLKLIVNVGDYRERREEQLQEMAQQAASEVASTSESVTLPYLTSYERRIVHTVLSEHPEVFSESVGEGNDRRLIIKKRNV